jgi:hypothetical protein
LERSLPDGASSRGLSNRRLGQDRENRLLADGGGLGAVTSRVFAASSQRGPARFRLG